MTPLVTLLVDDVRGTVDARPEEGLDPKARSVAAALARAVREAAAATFRKTTSEHRKKVLDGRLEAIRDEASRICGEPVGLRFLVRANFPKDGPCAWCGKNPSEAEDPTGACPRAEFSRVVGRREHRYEEVRNVETRERWRADWPADAVAPTPPRPVE